MKMYYIVHITQNTLSNINYTNLIANRFKFSAVRLQLSEYLEGVSPIQLFDSNMSPINRTCEYDRAPLL